MRFLDSNRFDLITATENAEVKKEKEMKEHANNKTTNNPISTLNSLAVD